MARVFTIAEARAQIPDLRRHVDHLVAVRADFAAAQRAVAAGDPDAVGGLAEAKALEARLQEAIDWFGSRGIECKGIAPVIVDFPSQVDATPALLCWLEGETSLDWFHDPDLGFMGRRRLPG